MRMRRVYYWVVEELDDSGDIIDDSFFESLPECNYSILTDPTRGIGLVRCDGNAELGEVYRSYAYIVDGKLPSHFPDGLPVPVRYLRELDVWLRKRN